MAMNKLQQEIRRKCWNDILEQPSNRSRESKKLHWLQHETWALHETNYVMCSWQQKLGFELDAEALLNPISYVSRGSWFKSSARDVLDADNSN